MKTPDEIRQETLKIAHEVIQGKWGTGEQRQTRLTNAGHNYNKIMKTVEEILKKNV